MLERATACLKPGAARNCIQSACKASKSKRLLHSTFWEHSAIRFDLPPWLTSAQPSSYGVTPAPRKSTLPSHCDIHRSNRKRYGNISTVADGIFLDFLYPPQLLAWFDARQKQKWGAREGRRSSEGFVVRSRGYVSTSQPAYETISEDTVSSHLDVRSAQDELAHAEREEPEGTDAALEFDKMPTNRPRTFFQPMDRLKDTMDVYPKPGAMRDKYVKNALQNAFIAIHERDSPAQSGEQTTPISVTKEKSNTRQFPKMRARRNPIKKSESATSLQNLWQSLQSSDSSAELVGLEQSQVNTLHIWNLYNELDTDSRNDSRLRSEVFLWLLKQGNKAADTLGGELYSSIPQELRTLDIYRAALHLYLRKREIPHAKEVHEEALQNIENGHDISKIFFRYALDAGMWQLAAEIESKHRKTYVDTTRSNQIALFWFNVSEIDQLLQKVIPLSTYLSMPVVRDRLDTEQCIFFCTLIREAIGKEYLSADQPTLNDTDTHSRIPAMRIRGLFRFLADRDENVAPFLTSFITAFTRPDSRFNYSEYHLVVSYVYKLYRRIPGAVPTEEFLMALLRCLALHTANREAVLRSHWSVSVITLTNDWKRFHGKLNIEGLEIMLKFYAQQGNVKSFESWWDHLMTNYPLFTDHKMLLWTSVYLHVCRVDLGSAQLAFAKIKRTAREHGESPDLRSWNMLILAHARVDDVQGGMLSLHHLIHEAKLTPDAYSFHPITDILGRRGEVEGVQKLLKHYDNLTSEPRQTALYGSLIQAYIRSEQYDPAEKVLQEVTSLVADRKVEGPLSPCFNIILRSLAGRFRTDSILRVYRWMKSRDVPLDAGSYAQLMYCLCSVRQVSQAASILNKVMPQRKIEATAAHYAICMNGYNLVGMHDAALWTHHQMKKRNIASSVSTHTAYLTARAAIEASRLDKARHRAHLPLYKTLNDLTEILDLNERSWIQGQQSVSGWNDSGETVPGAPFEILIRAHTKRRCFEIVYRLFQQYMSLSGRGEAGEPPPLRLTIAMSDAYSAAGEYKEVDECWRLAKKMVDDATAPVKLIDLDRSLPGHLASLEDGDLHSVQKDELDHLGDLAAITGHDAIDEAALEKPEEQTVEPAKDSVRVPPQRPVIGRRYMLSHALRSYISSLHKQNRLKDEIVVVINVLKQGYALDGPTWNIFIKHLCQHSPPLAQLAFAFTERYLIQNFKGWSWESGESREANSRNFTIAGFDYMNKQMAPSTHAMPQYATMILLADALLELRRIDVVGRKPSGSVLDKYVGSLRAVRQLCPKTLYAVQAMPRMIGDKLQADISVPRREPKWKNYASQRTES